MDDAASQPMTTPEQPAPVVAVRAGRRPASLALFLLITFSVLAADLAIKTLAFQTVAGRPVQLDPEHPEKPNIPPHDPIVILPGILSLKLTTNTGAVFGLGQGGRWVFIAVSLVACALILRIFWRSPARAWALHTGLALILAGALGNLYDRVRFSAVRDMFYLFPGVHLPFGLSWPGAFGGDPRLWPWIFNLADAALMVGVAGVILLTWLNEQRRSGDGSRPG